VKTVVFAVLAFWIGANVGRDMTRREIASETAAAADKPIPLSADELLGHLADHRGEECWGHPDAGFLCYRTPAEQFGGQP